MKQWGKGMCGISFAQEIFIDKQKIFIYQEQFLRVPAKTILFPKCRSPWPVSVALARFDK